MFSIPGKPKYLSGIIALLLCMACSPTAPESTLKQPGGLGAKPPQVLRQARAVVYKLARSKKPPKQANINLGQANISISLRPQDFKNAEIYCNEDECTAVLIEPVAISATIPVGLQTKIKVHYRQARTSQEEAFSHHVQIGGQWNLFKVGEILSVSIEAGFSFESTPHNNYYPVLKDIYCSKTLSCETPLFVINGTIDKKGIQFDSRFVSTLQEGEYVKVVSDLIANNQKIPFDKVKSPQWFDQLPSGSPPGSPCRGERSYDALWSQDDSK